MSGPASEQELIVQISDAHIGYPAAIRDPETSLAAAVAEVLTLDPQPVAVILSGDLTNNGTAEQYRRLRELIEPLPMPVHPMMGNHDDRDALREAFSDNPEVAATEGPVQYAVRCGGMRLIACDSFASAETDAGELGPERLAWIERELEAGAGIPTILAVHHAPIATGIAGFDEIGLPEQDRRALARMLTRAQGVERVVSGHIHRTIFTEVGGVPVVVCPSVFLAAELNLSGQGAIDLVDEPPALAIHVHRRGKRLLSHIHPVPQPE